MATCLELYCTRGSLEEMGTKDLEKTVRPVRTLEKENTKDTTSLERSQPDADTCLHSESPRAC